MNIKGIVAILLVFPLIVSCTTQALWEVTDPGEYVEVVDASITVEQLEAEGVNFYLNERNGRLYVEKSGMSRFANYTVRTLATPVTVVVDAAGTVVVVVVAAAAQSGYSGTL